MNGKFDARAIGQMAKERYEKLGNVFLFRIEEIQYNAETKRWIVRCSFYDNLLGNKRVYYKIEIDAEDGNFIDEKRLEEA